MEKVKIDLSGYADKCQEIKIKGSDDVVITVRDHISVAEKLNFMNDFIRSTFINMKEYCYDSFMQVVTEKALVVRYYTNVDTDGYTDEEVYDFVMNNNLFDSIAEYICRDMEDVSIMCTDMRNAILMTTENEVSLSSAIRKSFGFLFDGKDVSETFAEATELKEQLLGVVETLKHAGEVQKDSKVSVNGAVINFAQKE